jgi:hypothetical protein
MAILRRYVHRRAVQVAILSTVVALTVGVSGTRGMPARQLTVYEDNLALINTGITWELTRGTNTLELSPVSALLNPASVVLRFPERSDEVLLLAQDYLNAVAELAVLLRSNRGREIELLDSGGDLVRGTLFGYDGGSVIILRPDSSVVSVLRDKVARVSFPRLPESLVPAPELRWLVHSEYAGETTARISYLTGGINWTSHYTAVRQGENRLHLSCFAELDNGTEVGFSGYALRFISGQIHRVSQKRMRPFLAEERPALVAGAQQAQERSFFDYHLFDVPGEFDIEPRSKKQIPLLSPRTATVEVRYEIRSWDSYERRANAEWATPFMYLTATNSKKSGLGVYLPAGTVRVYGSDGSGLELVGEDVIGRTPVGEDFRLELGRATDVTAERRLVSEKRIGQRIVERSFLIRVSNRKASRVAISLLERLYGDWELLKQSPPSEHIDAHTVAFQLDIGPGESVDVSYTVRSRE